MKLKNVMFCVECEEIFDPAGVHCIEDIDIMQCPSCGNTKTARLSCWLKTMNDHEKKQGRLLTSALPCCLSPLDIRGEKGETHENYKRNI